MSDEREIIAGEIHKLLTRLRRKGVSDQPYVAYLMLAISSSMLADSIGLTGLAEINDEIAEKL